MTNIIEITTAVALVLSIIIPGAAFLLGEKTKKRYNKISGCKLLLLLWNSLCGYHRHVRRNSERTGCY